MSVLPGLLKKPTDNEEETKSYEKARSLGQTRRRFSKKCKISQSIIFMEKAHSLGQTYVCPGLIKPSLGTDIGTCVPA